MQTNFSLTQLLDPNIADANDILRSCVHCGFCTATCPTYALMGDELDGPRGRIYLIKDMLEQDRAASKTDVHHIDRCLSCLSCMTTCPSGVNYKHLLDYGRRHIEQTYSRKFFDQTLRTFLGFALPNSKIFKYIKRTAMLARPFAPILPKGLRKSILLVSNRNKECKVVTPQVYKAQGERKYRVILLTGCVQDSLDPAINQATIRILNRHGCEVLVHPEGGCCGSVNQNLGQQKRAVSLIKANVARWSEMDKVTRLDGIIVNASGCGTILKDYGFLLRNDSKTFKEAEKVSQLACDITEFIARIGLNDCPVPGNLRVAYQSPCSMQHGQKIHCEPIGLLRACGFKVVEPKDQHLCCGSAGTYNVLQSEIADRLRERKIKALSKLLPDIVASGNIGCIMQLGQAGGNDMPYPIVHTVELLDWATGGPAPEALAGVTLGPS